MDLRHSTHVNWYKWNSLVGTPRSTNQYLLQIPKTRLKTYGDDAFSVAGPTKWNRLPGHIRLAPTIECFKSKLKRNLFDIAFKLID